MESFIWFLATAAVAVIFGELATRIKIPLGGIIGAMAGVIFLNVISKDKAFLYPQLKTAMQITIVAISGSRVGREELKNMLRLLKPAFIIYPMYFLIALVFGIAIYKFSDLDAITSMLMACPGGASDIALLAEDFGADVAYTGVLHVARVVFCCAVLPPAFTWVMRRVNAQKNDKADIAEGAAETNSVSKELKPQKKHPIWNLVSMLVLATVGGLIFKAMNIASGAIIGALLFSILFSCIFGKCKMPKWVRKIQLITTGAYVGATVTTGVLLSMQVLAVPVLLLILEIIVSASLVSFLVYKTGKLDLATIFPSCSPGGMAEMILLADEMGGDVSTVAVIQAFRIVLVVTLFPTLLNLLIKFII